MLWPWLEIRFGVLVIIPLLGLAVKPSKEKVVVTNDEIVLNKARQELDNYDYYEIESIESLDKTTTVIANIGFLEIAIDIDNKTGQTLSKERIARQ